NRLEAAGSPATVDVEPRDRSRPDDRARIVYHVDDPGPLPHQAQATEGGEHRERRGDDRLQHREAPALRVGGKEVEECPDHHLALVGLAEVCARGRREYYRIERGL